jgi:hypothetical protein
MNDQDTGPDATRNLVLDGLDAAIADLDRRSADAVRRELDAVDGRIRACIAWLARRVYRDAPAAPGSHRAKAQTILDGLSEDIPELMAPELQIAVDLLLDPGNILEFQMPLLREVRRLSRDLNWAIDHGLSLRETQAIVRENPAWSWAQAAKRHTLAAARLLAEHLGAVP